MNLKVSGDTLLKLISRRDDQKSSPVRVLGVDDFAFRRGIRYGTILVDLERRQPVDLLPDRESSTLKQWLALHPEVEIISRDRSKTYAEAATNGAPHAIQVADRWHLLKNLGEYLERLLLRHHSLWRNKINQMFLSTVQADQTIEVNKSKNSKKAEERLAGIRPEVAARHQARSEAYKQVFELLAQAVPIAEVAACVGKSTRTIFRWVKEGECRLRTRNKRSELDRYWGFIKQWRFQEYDNIQRLWRELQKQGYTGSSMTVRRYVERHQLLAVKKRKRQKEKKNEREISIKPPVPLITPRAAVLKLLHYDNLKEEEKPVITQILQSSPEIEKAVQLGREFERLLKDGDEIELDQWLSKAKGVGIAEIKSFARGLEQDKSAVQAAVKYEWSNGQTEGQVGRLKLIKRQMYGRANFDLLKARVIHRA